MNDKNVVMDRFVFYRSFEESISTLGAKSQLLMYKSIVKFALYAERPRFKSGTLTALWELIEPVLKKQQRNFVNGSKGASYGSLGGAPKGNHNAVKNNPQTTPDKDKDIDKDIDKDNKKKTTQRTTFVAPSLSDLEELIRERKYTFNPQKFIDYYTANGWRVGKNPMKDWRAAASQWQQREREFPNNKNYKYEQRDNSTDTCHFKNGGYGKSRL